MSAKKYTQQTPKNQEKHEESPLKGHLSATNHTVTISPHRRPDARAEQPANLTERIHRSGGADC